MGKIKRAIRHAIWFPRIGYATLSSVLILSGCATPQKTEYVAKSEIEIAIGSMNSGLLVECAGPDTIPENTVGALLSDLIALSAAYAECRSRQHSLVQYLYPLYKQELSK